MPSRRTPYRVKIRKGEFAGRTGTSVRKEGKFRRVRLDEPVGRVTECLIEPQWLLELTSETELGQAAHVIRLYQWGEDERSRAGRMAVWGRNNPERPKGDNPYRREAVYSPADFERVRNFDRWTETHPNEPYRANPYAHPSMLDC